MKLSGSNWLMGLGFLFTLWGAENVLELDGRCGFTTVWICYAPLNRSL